MTFVRDILIGTLVMSSCLPVCAQTWEDVKADGTSYIWGEGWGSTIEEADREAMSALVGKISMTVISEFKAVEGQSSSGRGTSRYSSIDHNVRSFSAASISGSGMQVLQSGKRSHVVRWIGRGEIERIQRQRCEHVFSYIADAQRSEQDGRFSDALRGYYWAYAMVKAYPEVSSFPFRDIFGEEHSLPVWLPQTISMLFSDLKACVSPVSERQANIAFYFRGRVANGVEFSYFDGMRWNENLYAQDGRRTIFLAYNTRPEYIHIKLEYLFPDDAVVDKELSFALDAIKNEPMRRAYLAVPYR